MMCSDSLPFGRFERHTFRSSSHDAFPESIRSFAPLFCFVLHTFSAHAIISGTPQVCLCPICFDVSITVSRLLLFTAVTFPVPPPRGGSGEPFQLSCIFQGSAAIHSPCRVLESLATLIHWKCGIFDGYCPVMLQHLMSCRIQHS